MVIYRELTGGIYFGKKGREANGEEAYDECRYTTAEIIRIAKMAFETAVNSKKKVTLVDKANVLETSRLWRQTVLELAKTYPHVEVNCMFVDNAAMQLILNPRQFDVILTENMFGDIISDEASVIAGSIGLLPSASLGEKYALYEPIHGSYPQAKDKNIANPMAAILSAAMMLEYSFGMLEESNAIKKSVTRAINEGFVTVDINPEKSFSTTEVGDKICTFIQEITPVDAHAFYV